VTSITFPDSPAEASEAVAADEGAVVHAGGTLLVPLWHERGWPERIVSLRRAGLSGIDGSGCGAATVLRDLAVSPEVPAAVRAAAASVGGPAVRASATVGGNVLGDGPQCVRVALLVLDATVETEPGRELRRLEELPETSPGRLLARIGWDGGFERSGFLKLGVRPSGGPYYASVAAARAGREIRLAVGSTGRPPHRLREAEARWLDAVGNGASAAQASAVAAAIAASSAEVASDEVAQADYRRHVFAVLVRRLLDRLAERHE
jgi:CO/xanthine dehydrogenase FAD-binding subunit